MLFSYDKYIAIVTALTQFVPLLDLEEVSEKTGRFCIRHNIEFSVERAHTLTKLEEERLDVCIPRVASL